MSCSDRLSVRSFRAAAWLFAFVVLPLLLSGCITSIDKVDITGLFRDSAGTLSVDADDVHGVVLVGYHVEFTYNPNLEADPPEPEKRIGVSFFLKDSSSQRFPAPGGSILISDLLPDGEYALYAKATPSGLYDEGTADSGEFPIKIKNGGRAPGEAQEPIASKISLGPGFNLCFDCLLNPVPESSRVEFVTRPDHAGTPQPLVMRDENDGRCNKSVNASAGAKGDPIQLANGTLVFQEDDLIWPTIGGNFGFMRTYNSRLPTPTGIPTVTAPVIPCGAVAGPVPSNVLVHWTGDDTASDTTGTFPGTLSSGVTYACGLFGRAFEFHGGDDLLSVPDYDALTFGMTPSYQIAPFTVSLWVKFDGLPQQKEVLLTKKYPHHPPTGFQIMRTAGDARVIFDPGKGNEELKTPPLQNGVWHHIAAIQASNRFELYANGVLASTKPIYDLVPGWYGPRIGGGLRGQLDEIRVYNRNLAQDEICALFAAGQERAQTNPEQAPAACVATFTHQPPCGTTTQPCAVPFDLLSHWRGDDDAVDAQGFNSGVVVGDVTYGCGLFNRSFTFHGNDGRIEVPHTTTLDSGDFSVSAWFKGSGSLAHDQILISKTDPNNPVNGWKIVRKANSAQILFDPGKSNSVFGTYPIQDNIWQHIVAIKRGPKFELYLNGLYFESSPVMEGYPESTPLEFGRGFDGQLDDIRFFRRALDAGEIRALHQEGETESATNPHGLAAACVALRPPGGGCEFTGAPCPTPEDALSHWRGDDSAADEKGLHPGTLSGGAGFTCGPFYRAFSFDGVSSEVRIPMTSDLRVANQPFSVTGWVRFGAPVTVGDQILIGTEGATTSHGWRIFRRGANELGPADPSISFMLGVPFRRTTNYAPVAVHEWHHFAAIRYANTYEFYFDGVSLGPDDHGLTGPIDDTADLILGRGLQGDLDDIRIYNRDLTKVDVLGLYRQGAERVARNSSGAPGECLSGCLPCTVSPTSTTLLQWYGTPPGPPPATGTGGVGATITSGGGSGDGFAIVPSQHTRQSGLGTGWTHGYDRHIVDQGPRGAAEIDGRGAHLLFPRISPGVYGPPSIGNVELTRDSSGWHVRYPVTSRTFDYRIDGKLDRVVDGYGNITQLTYDESGNLVRITDPAGKSLELEVDEHGLIRSITAKNGQKVHYAYNSNRELVAVSDLRGKLTSYTYAPGGDLARITRPNGDTVDYTYTGNRVTQVVEHNAATDRSATSSMEYPSDTQRRFIDPEGRATWYELDANGLLVSSTDNLGRVTTYERDAVGRLTKTTEPGGTSIHRWTYDASGFIATYTSPTGAVTSYTRDPNTHVPTVEQQPDGTSILREFDSAGNITRKVDGLNQQVRTTYDQHGQVTSIIDAENRATAFTYDQEGNLLTATDPLGRVTAHEYDTLGRRTKTTSPGNRESTYEYEGRDLLAAVVDAAGQRSTIEYDDLNRPKAVVRSDGARTELKQETVNGVDRITEMKDPSGAIWKFGYDASDRLTSREDPLGRVTSYLLDNLGRVTLVNLPSGFELVRYNSVGLVAEIENARGAITRFTYDAASRVTAVERPDGSTVGVAYDAKGRVTGITRPDGGVIESAYDAADRLIGRIDPLGHITRFEYSPTGVLTRSVNRRDKATTYERDAADRRTSITDPLNRVSRFEYGASDQTLKVIRPSGAETAFTYDAMLRLTGSTDPLGHSIGLGRDQQGRPISFTDQRGSIWTFSYDLRDLPLTATDPGGRAIHYTYDGARQLTLVELPDHSKWRYSHDQRGRVLERRLEKPDGSLEDQDTFTYDAVGNTTSSENAAVRIVSTYDIMDREASRTVNYKLTGSVRTLAFTYDAVGRRRTVTDTQGRVVTTTYDQNDRPTQLVLLEPVPAIQYLPAAFRSRAYTFAWSNEGELVHIDYPNGIRATRNYDDAGRLVSLVHDRPDGPGRTVVSSRLYGYDANGNITQVQNERSETTHYEYDLKDQLIRALLPSSVAVALREPDPAHPASLDDTPEESIERAQLMAEDTRYTYDPAGNRIQQKLDDVTITSTFNTSNEILTRGAITYVHDARGQLTERSRPGKKELFSWSVAGHLAQYAREISGTTPTVEIRERHAYAPNAQRVFSEDVLAGHATNYQWDSGRVIDQWTRVTASGSTDEKGSQHFRGPSNLELEQSGYTRSVTQSYEDIFAAALGGEADESTPTNPEPATLKHLRWLLPDQLGSTVALTKHIGEPAERLTYGPFGEPMRGGFGKAVYTYADTQRGAGSGLQYAWHRWYDAAQGRFLSRDPIGFEGGLNLYAYVENNPVNSRDPLGLDPDHSGVSPTAWRIANTYDRMSIWNNSVGKNYKINVHPPNVPSPPEYDKLGNKVHPVAKTTCRQPMLMIGADGKSKEVPSENTIDIYTSMHGTANSGDRLDETRPGSAFSMDEWVALRIVHEMWHAYLLQPSAPGVWDMGYEHARTLENQLRRQHRLPPIPANEPYPEAAQNPSSLTPSPTTRPGGQH